MRMTSGMVGRDGVGDRLQHHRLAGPRRRHDEAALALADGGHQVHDPAGHVAFDLQVDALQRVERRQVVEQHLLLGEVGRLEVDRLHLDEGEVALALLRRADLPRHRVAGAQVEAPDLRGRDVDVVRARQVVVLRGAQEAVAVGQDLQHPFAEDQALSLGLRLQDLEDEVLLAHPGRVLDLQVARHLREVADGHVLERPHVQTLLALGRRRLGLQGLLVEHHRQTFGVAGTRLATTTTAAALHLFFSHIKLLVQERPYSRVSAGWPSRAPCTHCR